MGNKNDTDKALIILGRIFKIFAAVVTIFLIVLIVFFGYFATNPSTAGAAQAVNRSVFNETREVPILGLLPGVSLEQAISVFGEPVLRDGDELFFSNGVKIELDNFKNVVEEIRIRSAGVTTPEGLAVGMSEGEIQTRYGTADKVERDNNGEVEYKYYSKDSTKSFKIIARGGVVVEMKSELRD